MRSLETGRSVKFTDKAKKFYLKESYDFNVIGTEIMKPSNAETYLAWNLLGRGYPYKAKILRKLSNDVYQVQVKFKCGLVFTTNARSVNLI